MKIVFDLTPIYDHLTGIERYNINISKEIIKAHPDDEYVLLFKNEVHSSFKDEIQQSNVQYILIPECNKLIFIQWRLYKILRKLEADYYIFLSFTSPVLFKKKRIINAIHDLTCWDCAESIPTKMKYYYRYTYKIAAARSWKLVTVSKFSQKRICEKYNLTKDKVPVIYDGLTDIFREAPHDNPYIKEKYHLSDRYLLSLSTLEPRKNLQLLIRAYKELVEEKKELPDLVLAGREGWKLDDVVGNIDTEVRKRIHFTGFIDDDDLAQIYRDAELFVFPSKYEGFGLPLIEAMSQGTIVISSNAASLPEIAQDSCYYFESDDLQDLKNKIMFALNEQEKELQVLKKSARDIALRYRWDMEAEKLYRILINNN